MHSNGIFNICIVYLFMYFDGRYLRNNCNIFGFRLLASREKTAPNLHFLKVNLNSDNLILLH